MRKLPNSQTIRKSLFMLIDKGEAGECGGCIVGADAIRSAVSYLL